MLHSCYVLVSRRGTPDRGYGGRESLGPYRSVGMPSQAADRESVCICRDPSSLRRNSPVKESSQSISKKAQEDFCRRVSGVCPDILRASDVVEAASRASGSSSSSLPAMPQASDRRRSAAASSLYVPVLRRRPLRHVSQPSPSGLSDGFRGMSAVVCTYIGTSEPGGQLRWPMLCTQR